MTFWSVSQRIGAAFSGNSGNTIRSMTNNGCCSSSSSRTRKWYTKSGILGGLLLFLLTGILLYSIELLSSVALTERFMYQDDTKNDVRANDTRRPIVMEVTRNGILEETSTHHRVVEFYSPYCGHCIRFKPTYLAVAREAKDEHQSKQISSSSTTTTTATTAAPLLILFYAVSCVGVPELCEQYQIQSYPSVFVVPAGATMAQHHVDMDTGAFGLTEIKRILQQTSTTTSTTGSTVPTIPPH